MVAKDMQPLSIVEDKGFIAFCKELDEKYQLPTRKTLRLVHLPVLFFKTQGASSVCGEGLHYN